MSRKHSGCRLSLLTTEFPWDLSGWSDPSLPTSGALWEPWPHPPSIAGALPGSANILQCHTLYDLGKFNFVYPCVWDAQDLSIILSTLQYWYRDYHAYLSLQLQEYPVTGSGQERRVQHWSLGTHWSSLKAGAQKDMGMWCTNSCWDGLFNNSVFILFKKMISKQNIVCKWLYLDFW